jgi:hypothetical protein
LHYNNDKTSTSTTTLSVNGIMNLSVKIGDKLKNQDPESVRFKFTYEVLLVALKIKSKVDQGLFLDGAAYVASTLNDSIADLLTAINNDNAVKDDDLSLDDVILTPLTLEEFTR